MQMLQKVIYGGGAAYNLDLGFIPTYVRAMMFDSATAVDFIDWHGPAQEESITVIAGSGEYGVMVKEGVTSLLDTAAKGISVYDGARTPQILLDHPSTEKPTKVTITGDYTVARSTAATARTATAFGTILRPTTHNGYVYECITAGTGSAEPTWPTTPGETVLDNDVKYICREENLIANKSKGITLGATMMESDKEWFLEIFRADREEDIGDIG